MTASGPEGGAGIRRGILLALAGILCFAGIDVCSKLLGARMPVIQIIWLRFLLFLPIALAMASRRGRGPRWRSARPGLQAARVVILVVEMWFFIAAFTALPLADVQAIGAVTPLLVTALSVPVLGEKVGWRRWAAVGAGFAGVLLILRPGFAEIRLPMLFALGGAALWAVYQLILRVLGPVDSAETTALWTAGVGALVAGVAAPFAWEPPDARGWALLGAVTLLGGFGHLIYSKAFAHAPASTLQPFGFLLLVYAAIFGWLVFGDLPDAWTVGGATVIVVSGLYTFHRERVRATAAARAATVR